MVDPFPSPSLHLFKRRARVPYQRLVELVKIEPSGFAIHGKLGDVVAERAESLFTLSQRFLPTFPLGHISEENGNPIIVTESKGIHIKPPVQSGSMLLESEPIRPSSPPSRKYRTNVAHVRAPARAFFCRTHQPVRFAARTPD